MKRSLPVYLCSLLALSALAMLGPDASRPAGAQLRSLAMLSLLAPPAVPASYAIRDLGTLGGIYSVPNAINASGQAAGNSLTAGEAAVHAFLWANGKMQDLGTLGGANSGANAINAAGQVVGTSDRALVGSHAFLWANGKMQDLGTLGGSFSTAWGINTSGQVAGDSLNTAGTAGDALSGLATVTMNGSATTGSASWSLSSW